MTFGKKELRLCGEALFGPRWQTDLARQLGLSDGRRIRQWLSDDRPMPEGVPREILGLLKERKIEIEQILRGFNN